MNRGKRSVALDMKSEAGRDAAWRLLESADALIEGFRPGVMERLGFGPEPVAERAPKEASQTSEGFSFTSVLFLTSLSVELLRSWRQLACRWKWPRQPRPS